MNSRMYVVSKKKKKGVRTGNAFLGESKRESNFVASKIIVSFQEIFLENKRFCVLSGSFPVFHIRSLII